MPSNIYEYHIQQFANIFGFKMIYINKKVLFKYLRYVYKNRNRIDNICIYKIHFY